ncbi:hypothetical protein GLOIN_2v1673942 [Rhizophagus irregularis DAOM 181602=DAOM 197198]|nr:hypothetical protein GLOIN_2v1673942 [Rhizophagus irregularis DAOM 181602=DAOM 197198]
MSRNLARRGGGSYNPNSNKAARQEKKNNKKQLSDNSGSDSDNNSQKRSRILTKDSMDEDYEDFVADAPADGGFSWFQLRPLFLNKIIPAALPKKILKLLPRKFCCAYAPGQDASSGANASIHAPRNKENNPSLTRPLIWTLMMVHRPIRLLIPPLPLPLIVKISWLRLRPTPLPKLLRNLKPIRQL